MSRTRLLHVGPAVVPVDAAPVSGLSVVPVASRDDGLAMLRGAAVVCPEAIPAAPEGASKVTVDDRRSALWRVADDDIPVMLVGLDAYAACDDATRGALSDDVPARAEAAALADRIRVATATEARLQALIAATRLQRQVAVSDAHALLRDLSDEVRHRARRRPELTLVFAAVLDYVTRHARAIREGLARRQKRGKTATSASDDAANERGG